MPRENTAYGIIGVYKNIETGEEKEGHFIQLFSTKREAERSLISIGFEPHEDDIGKYFTRKADEIHPEHDLEHYIVEFALPEK